MDKLPRIQRNAQTMAETKKFSFRVSSRMPILLGDELIPSASYALFELVKNGHDADATAVIVDLIDADDKEKGRIIVEDDGCGMDEDVISGSWLVMGTSFRRSQVRDDEVTPKYERKVLGEKGIGRFASHKLGSRISIVTRMLNKPEFVINVDWTDFDPDEPQLIEHIPVEVASREPVVFTGSQTGTKIEVTALRETWTRGMARKLHREITSISSPFDAPETFEALLTVRPQEDWLDELFSYEQATEIATFIGSCTVEGDGFTYDYRLNVPSALEGRIEERSVNDKKMPFIIAKDDLLIQKEPYALLKNELNELNRIGQIKFELLMYDLDNDFVKATMIDPSGLRKFLRANGGIRVYRGGIRVFGLGGEGEDWLDLGGRRVQVPARRLSNNLIVGAVLLKPESSSKLTEQTNRRGFIENEAFRGFKKVLVQTISQFEAERLKDKDRIRSVISGKKVKMPVLDELLQLRTAIRKLGPEEAKKLEPTVARVEKAYTETRDMLVTAASSGLSLGAVVHDTEKQVKALLAAVEEDPVPVERVRDMVRHLATMMEGLTYLLKKSPVGLESMKNLVGHALHNLEHRFHLHGISVEKGFDGFPDLRCRCSRRFVVASIMNIIDNSIWWMALKSHEDKRIYIGPSSDLGPGPALVIADNGPGFSDDPEDLVKPFFTRKPDGMGLGLFLAEQSMMLQDGMLAFPGPGDVDLPDDMSGAVIALVFPEEES